MYARMENAACIENVISTRSSERSWKIWAEEISWKGLGIGPHYNVSTKFGAIRPHIYWFVLKLWSPLTFFAL